MEDALNSYEGTLLYVSHDRYFINRTASRILELTDKQLIGYLGNYDYYLEKKKDLESALTQNVSAHSPSQTMVSENKQDWLIQKELQARQRKRENDLKKCEAEISALEAEQSKIDAEMSAPENATNAAKLQELSARRETNDSRLSELYEKWETLADENNSDS